MPIPTTALEPGLVLPAEMTPAIREVLGSMIYMTGPIAHGFRAQGCAIPRKAEEEQAFVLFWLLKHAIKHGENWRQNAAPELPADENAATPA